MCDNFGRNSNINEQNKRIQDYHCVSKHRGIDETVIHLKRIYYFDNMKSKITSFINTCKTYFEFKYERHPLKFNKIKIPIKPFEIIHIDVFHLNKNYILTLFDKYSRYAEAFILPFKNLIEINKL